MASPVDSHDFSNAGIKAILDKYGSRVKYIKTIGTTICVGKPVPGSPFPYVDPANLTMYNAGGYDVFEYRCYDSYNRCEYSSVVRAADVSSFIIADKETDHIDPFRR